MVFGKNGPNIPHGRKKVRSSSRSKRLGGKKSRGKRLLKRKEGGKQKVVKFWHVSEPKEKGA